MLHEDAETRLLLDFMTDPIKVTFSVRQGDPVAMILFLLYIEPMLLRLEAVTSGYGMKACRLKVVPFHYRVGYIENGEAYFDEAEVVVSRDEEFIAVDELFVRFEAMSRAMFSRTRKSQVLGLGDWKTRKRWPLPWLRTVQKTKVFGVWLNHDWEVMLNRNWEDQLDKAKETLRSWSSRVINTVAERAQVVTTFALSRMWYRVQILPLPSHWAVKFEAEVSRFLWQGQQTVNLLPMETVCLPRDDCRVCWGWLCPFCVCRWRVWCCVGLVGD